MFEHPGAGLYLFGVVVFGYADLTEELHLPIARFVGRWGESVLADDTVSRLPPNQLDGEVVDSYRRLMVAIPRECFKTSLCTRANALWTVARDPTHNPTVGIFNEKAENSQAWVGAIAEVVERSQLFQVLWREMIPPGIGYWDKERGVTRQRNWKWGNTGLMFKRDAVGVPELSIEPHGIGGAHAGKHFTHKILDDIIGRDAAYSEAIMQYAINWADNSRPLERPAENGCELVVHTPWAYHDVYSHMRKRWAGEYRLHRRHILELPDGTPDYINGTSIFPRKISTLKAKQLLKTDRYVNMCQYQLQPMGQRHQSFSEDWFRYGVVLESGNPVFRIRPEHYDPELLDPACEAERAPPMCPLSWMAKAVLLDPAPSKSGDLKREPRSQNALVVVGIDPWGRRYCLDTATTQEGPTVVLRAIMDLCVRWGARLVGIEEVNFSAIYAPLFQALIRHEYTWEPDFVPCMTKGRDKDARIKDNLIRVFENGFWYFNQATCGALARQLVEFPTGDVKDLPDALSYTDEVLQRPETSEELELWETLERRQDYGRTGYGVYQRQEVERQ